MDGKYRHFYSCTANGLNNPNNYNFDLNSDPNSNIYKINANGLIPVLNSTTFDLKGDIIELKIVNSSIEKIEGFNSSDTYKAEFMQNRISAIRNNSLLMPSLKYLNISHNLIETCKP